MELLPIVEIADRSELMTLPVGRYAIPSERKIEPEYLDAREFEVYKDAPIYPIAHVRDELPRGIIAGIPPQFDITVRGDGKFIIVGWMADPEWVRQYWATKMMETRPAA